MHQGRSATGPAYISNVKYWLLGSIRKRDDRYETASLEPLAKGNLALGDREEGVVTSHANAFARPVLRSALTHNDIPGHCTLATKQLYAKTASSGIATVAG